MRQENRQTLQRRLVALLGMPQARNLPDRGQLNALLGSSYQPRDKKEKAPVAKLSNGEQERRILAARVSEARNLNRARTNRLGLLLLAGLSALGMVCYTILAAMVT